MSWSGLAPAHIRREPEGGAWGAGGASPQQGPEGGGRALDEFQTCQESETLLRGGGVGQGPEVSLGGSLTHWGRCGQGHRREYWSRCGFGERRNNDPELCGPEEPGSS